jgi:ABC-type sugar transport system ATPase subunit
MTAIGKRFTGTVALDGIDLELEAGTIHGLLGENGAGKSTLLKILAGDYRPSGGQIEIDGTPVEIDNPRSARALGIGIVYQELSLLPNLSVAHNISLGNELTHALRIDEEALRERAREVLERIGVRSIDPARIVDELSLAERQLVEIAKVLTLRRPRVLVFDEPTTSLNHHDVERLFRIMRALRNDGVALVFVSHRYREVLEICDASTVLRNGRVVGRVGQGEATLERLVELTLGQKAETVFHREWRAPADAEPVLRLQDVHVGGRVAGVDLQLRRGEILGVCGLLGSGQNELARAIFGDERDVTGAITLHGGAAAPRSPREAVGARVAMITESRQDEGLFPNLSVRSNISVASLDRLVLAPLLRLITWRRERREAAAAAARTGIASRVLAREIRTLSGGNQQKSLLARWLMRGCDLLICLEPTRGVDVGAKAEIYRQLEGLARDGAGVLVVSTDLPEILGLADRVVVLWRGRVEAELDPRSATEQQLLLAMQGGVQGEQRGLLEVVG